MEYKRLTKRKKDGSIVLNYFSHDFAPSDLIAHRLAELEDKIEMGTLIELPGVRKINIAGMDCVEAVYVQGNGTIGECVCLNEAEAKKMLEKMKNGI